jgi:hypothetical protein
MLIVSADQVGVGSQAMMVRAPTKRGFEITLGVRLET